jgi:alpha-ketoglutarate-dependent 2,4-dichlorophenoxyacetate dioxygenase
MTAERGSAIVFAFRQERATMTLPIRPIDPVNRRDFAAEVSGIDLREPMTPAQVAAIVTGMDKFAVLVFRDQQIDDAQQLAFSRNFGPLEEANADIRRPEDRRLASEIADISNLGRNNEILARDDRRRLFSLGNMLWHSDSSFKPTPAKYSLLHARVLPSKGGNTEFADMRAAYDALDEESKAEINDLVCEHSQIYSRGVLGFTEFTEEERRRNQPMPQRLVRRHPGSGRRSLFLSAHAGAIRGMPVPEARALLRDLTEHATQPRFVYAHRWRVGDLVMWDNRAMMHRARRYPAGEARELHRTTVADIAPTLEQAA